MFLLVLKNDSFSALNYLYVVDNGDCKKSSLTVANLGDFWELHLKIFLAVEVVELPSILGV